MMTTTADISTSALRKQQRFLQLQRPLQQQPRQRRLQPRRSLIVRQSAVLENMEGGLLSESAATCHTAELEAALSLIRTTITTTAIIVLLTATTERFAEKMGKIASLPMLVDFWIQDR